jgi:hypothetical protein
MDPKKIFVIVAKSGNKKHGHHKVPFSLSSSPLLWPITSLTDTSTRYSRCNSGVVVGIGVLLLLLRLDAVVVETEAENVTCCKGDAAVMRVAVVPIVVVAGVAVVVVENAVLVVGAIGTVVVVRELVLLHGCAASNKLLLLLLLLLLDEDVVIMVVSACEFLFCGVGRLWCFYFDGSRWFVYLGNARNDADQRCRRLW